MTSQESTVGRDSMGFENIDEFWDTIDVPAPVSSSAAKAGSGRRKSRTSTSLNTSQLSDVETFDYDTSDSIEEEVEEEVEFEQDNSLSIKSRKSANGSVRADDADISWDTNNQKSKAGPGSRYSTISNISLESTLGGSLPLGDSDDEKEESPDEIMPERMSLDSLYDASSSMSSSASRNSKNAKSGNIPQGRGTARRKSSVSTVRNGAQGRMGNNFESPVKEKRVSLTKKEVVDDDDQSDDTTDMSAIPMDPNNQEESLESVEFNDFDALSPAHVTSSASAAASQGSGRKRSSGVRLDSRANRRVSFGDGTKQQLERQEREQQKEREREREREVQDDMIVEDEITMIPDTYDNDYDDNDNEEGRRYSSSTGESSDSPEREKVTKSRKSSASSSSSSSTSATPRSLPASRPKYSSVETPGSHEFVRGRVIADESFVEDADGDGLRNSDSENEDGDGEEGGEDDDMRGGDQSFVQDTSFLQAIKNRVKRKGSGDDSRRDSRASTDQEGEDEEEEEEEEEDSNGATRRSSRITKGKRLAYWRGERPVYQNGRMVGLLVADKTPVKSKKEVTKSKRAKMSVRHDATDSEEDDRMTNMGHTPVTHVNSNASKDKKETKSALPSKISLPKDVAYLRREVSDEMAIWDDLSDAAITLKVLCHGESLRPLSALPVTAVRKAGKEKVGFAAQSFNMPEIAGVMSGWISGFVELPAGAIKDAEGVGECSQVFFVSECQDGGLELGIADPAEDEWKDAIAQRTLLKKGDSFFIPPGNIYRLENHSTTVSCTLFWAIVRPLTTAPSLKSNISPVKDATLVA